MAINWIEGVLQNSRHSGSDLLLMLVLAESASREEGTCWPGKKLIARMMRMSERQAQRCIQNVIDSGEVSVIPQGSHLGTNLYRLNPSLLKGGDKMSGGDTHDAKGESPLSPKPLVEPSDKEITRARKTRLGAEWQPSESETTYAQQQGIRDVTAVAEDFRDYWVGRGEPMADWTRTWQRWCREHVRRQKSGPSRFSTRPTPTFGATDAY